MVWDFESIDRDWLTGSKIAVPPDEIVAAFNIVESTLGQDWIGSAKISGGAEIAGTFPTLHIVKMGKLLAASIGVGSATKLLDDLRLGKASAISEVTAIYLLRSGQPNSQVELYPEVTVGSGPRVPDFRIRLDDLIWSYVEVTRPDTSEVHERARSICERITNLVVSIKNHFALEVFLRREPTEAELKGVIQAIPEFCRLQGRQRQELLGGLGVLFLNEPEPGQIVVQNHAGEDVCPRIGHIKIIGGSAEPTRHITVNLAFSDERAERFLNNESKQLPLDAPGLILIEVSNAPGAFNSWEPLLRRRFQPRINTRVSAICLFAGGQWSTPDGEDWLIETKLLVNPHAKFELPKWIETVLIKSKDVT